MSPLNWLSDRFLRRDVATGRIAGMSFVGLHRRGFRRGYLTGLLTVGFVYTLVVLLGALGGCAPGVPDLADGECTETFALAGSTDSYGVYDATVPCYDDRPDGTRDLSDCCPEGWDALGLSPEGNGVVCAP